MAGAWLDIALALTIGYLFGADESGWAWAALGCYAVAYIVRSWWRGRAGLDQWPHPYGRYYNEWCALKTTRLNYYDWLAARKGNIDPWRTWADLDRDIDARYVRSLDDAPQR